MGRKKGGWDVLFLLILGVVLIFVTPIMPFDELGAFALAFFAAVS